MLKLGVKAKDKVSGFEGLVTARATYLTYGEDRYMLEGIDSTGRPVEWWCDESRLYVTDETQNYGKKTE